MPQKSFGGAKYIMTIQDQFSRFTFCYLLKDKTQTAEEFESWLKFVERKTGEKVKTVQSDNGMEFKGEPFQKVIKKYGLKHRFSAPYCPTQNAYIERRQQTLQNMIQTLLADSKLSPHYWGECALYSCFSMNATYHSALNCSPYEKWCGRKPMIKYFHSFGAPSYVVSPIQTRRKGEAKARKMYFLGYQSNRKAMRFGDEYGRIIVSASAKIDDGYGLEECGSQTIMSDASQNGKSEENRQTPRKGKKEVVTPERVEKSEKEEEVSTGESSSSNLTPVVPRRTGRIIKPPERYSPSVNYVNECEEPESYEDLEKLNEKEKKQWLLAIEKELKSLQEMNVYETVDCPVDKKIIGCRWIFKRKKDANGEVRFRARLVAKGYLQTANDFDQVYSPTLRAESLRAVLAYAAKNKCDLRHIDFECAYLNSELEHEIYMEIPAGVADREGKCWRLQKSLYGLKQSAFQWNSHLSETLVRLGFEQGTAEQCLFRKGKQIVLIFVDDILICSSSENESEELVRKLQSQYKLRDLGQAKNYLGIEIERMNGGFKISQRQKIVNLVKQYNMEQSKGVRSPMITGFDKDCNESKPCNIDLYRSLIGSLLYLSQWSRPDISMAVNFLSKFNHQPTQKHWYAAKWIVRYLNETKEKCLCINPDKDLKLNAFADANFGSDEETRKSNTGIAIYMGKALIHWKSIQQNIIALSTSEAEICSLSTLINELIWFKQLLVDMNVDTEYAIDVYEDNQATIAMAKSLNQKARTKHIDIRYNHVKQCVANKVINLKYCESERNAADCFTKILGPTKHLQACEMLGLK